MAPRSLSHKAASNTLRQRSGGSMKLNPLDHGQILPMRLSYCATARASETLRSRVKQYPTKGSIRVGHRPYSYGRRRRGAQLRSARSRPRIDGESPYPRDGHPRERSRIKSRRRDLFIDPRAFETSLEFVSEGFALVGEQPSKRASVHDRERAVHDQTTARMVGMAPRSCRPFTSIAGESDATVRPSSIRRRWKAYEARARR